VLAKLFSMKRTSWTFVSEHAQVLDYDGTRLTLGISTVGLANTFRRGQHAELVRQALIDVLGVDARVEGIPTPDASHSAPSGSPHPTIAPGRQPSAAPAAPESSGSSGSPEASDGGWASAPASPESGPSWGSAPSSRAPSWASEPPPADDEVAPESAYGGVASSDRERSHTGSRQASQGSVSQQAASRATPQQSPLQRAQAAVAAEGPTATPQQRIADDTAASDDDEDIADLGEVGRPVIERILGGTVIDESER
jgi:DNA polymerase-3 subunit gamma/tau